MAVIKHSFPWQKHPTVRKDSWHRFFEGNKRHSNKLDEVEKKHIELAESVIRENIEQERKKEGQKEFTEWRTFRKFHDRDYSNDAEVADRRLYFRH